MTIPSLSRGLRCTLIATLALAAGANFLPAQQPEKPVRDYSLSDDTIEEMAKYKAAEEKKDFAGAIAIVEARMAKIQDQNSYDYAMLLEYKAQAMMQNNDFIGAIVPLERGLEISDAHTPTYQDENTTQTLIYYLAQLYFQKALNEKTGPNIPTYYDKAEHYIARWLKTTKKPTLDALNFYSSLLYNRAILDQNHPDKEKLKQAMKIADDALHLSIHPKDNLYILKLACLSQLEDFQGAIDILELLVKMNPESKTYWNQLLPMYVQTNQDVRAIVTYERAQALGQLNAPKDNYNLVGLYFNLGQFEHAGVLLEKGLHNNTIEEDQKNWELLSFCYQQLDRPFKAIDVLKEAAKRFPEAAQLEYLIGQNYYSLGKNEEAMNHLKICADKGGGNRPSQTYMFLAYVSFELKKYDVALAAANKAATYPDSKDKAASMKKAIESAQQQREEKLKKM
ncbi:MAG TPA: tetratricopeptide repeat protein [Candidatus Didemnitutus sp.]|nr:tetratricopeptide repeat protein [Candidatus Didemnitutus sp.]